MLAELCIGISIGVYGNVFLPKQLASDTYDMIDKQYKNNLVSINDVLDALNDLEKANFKLQESFFNQRRAVTDLLHAKGILNY